MQWSFKWNYWSCVTILQNAKLKMLDVYTKSPYVLTHAP